MEIPLQVTLHGVKHSDALDRAIRDKAARLEHYYERITSCRVSVQFTARLYSVHIHLKVPGGEIAVTQAEDQDLYVALRGAFDAATRRLEDHARVQRGDVKRHSRPEAE